VTAMVSPRLGIRAQADILFAMPDQSKWEGVSIFPRVVVGAVIRLAAPPRAPHPKQVVASKLRVR
jgi:hypothetical protein